MKTLPRIILKKGREKSLLRGHPWVFSGAVEKTEGEALPGEEREVYSSKGEFLGVGHFNPHSQIILRMVTKSRGPVARELFRERILAASSLRKDWLKDSTNAYRVVNAEGDFLPGLVIDRYGEVFVLQFLTTGMERLRAPIIQWVAQEFHVRSIYERSDTAGRREEGLTEETGLLFGEEVADRIEIKEYGSRFKVNVKKGQKTGFYLDQRENRAEMDSLSNAKRVLDCFSYTGAFSVHAGFGGARELTLVDSSEEALQTAEENFELNHLKPKEHRFIQGDVFEVMRRLEPGYDLVVLDPPPFAKKKSHLPGASRGYKDLNLSAFRLLNKGGLLFTFSCSHYMSWDLFQKVLFSAAVDAGREVEVLGRRGHPIDHPFSLFHPEGEYLKGMICRVL